MTSLWPECLALLQILLIDLTLAGDNAVVVGLVAATVPKDRQRKVIAGGVAVAVLLRIALAAVARQLLGVVGLTLSGGLLLMWVAWKLFRQLRAHKQHEIAAKRAHTSTLQAIGRIALADLSMSLDNVLAVAGAATGHPAWVLASGLGLAVLFMAIASHAIARMLERMPWLSYAGLAVVVFVAGRMIWLGGGEVINAGSGWLR
jgi:YjbE family integral membrane protein